MVYITKHAYDRLRLRCEEFKSSSDIAVKEYIIISILDSNDIRRHYKKRKILAAINNGLVFILEEVGKDVNVLTIMDYDESKGNWFYDAKQMIKEIEL